MFVLKFYRERYTINMNNNPFEIKIIAAPNDELTERQNAAAARAAQTDATVLSYEETNQRKLSRVMKMSKLTVVLIIILIVLVVGFGAYLVIGAVGNSRHNSMFEQSLNSMQQKIDSAGE